MKSMRFLLAMVVVCVGSTMVDVAEADASLRSRIRCRMGQGILFKRGCRVKVLRFNRCKPCPSTPAQTAEEQPVAPAPSVEIDIAAPKGGIKPKTLIAPPAPQEQVKPPAIVDAPPIDVPKDPEPVVKDEPKVIKVPKVEPTTKPQAPPFTLTPKTKSVDLELTPELPNPGLPQGNLSPFVAPFNNQNPAIKL
jgi:hypothetical protein